MGDGRPNIIYLVCHDLGKHIGCYGAGVASPCLDRFAAGGVKFTNAFCNSPACSPSRGCAQSGRYAHTNGLMGLVNQGWSMPPGTRTVVDHLNDAGYETVHFGLQHERWRASENRYKIEGLTRGEDECAEAALDRAIGHLESRRGSTTPFYMNIGTAEVHASRWQGNKPWSRQHIYGIDPEDRVHLPKYIPDFPQTRREFAKFQACIRYFDGQVQRLFNAVKWLGHEENTLVVVTTDHGIASERSKGTIYDRGVEIALLMRMPGTIGDGEVVDDLIQNIDLTPTLLEAAGVEAPESVQGRSFWRRLTGGEYSPHDEIFIERNYHGNFDPMRAVRTRRFHYIRNHAENPKRAWLPHEVNRMNESYTNWLNELWPEKTEPRDEEELFDVESDPDEFVNLANDPDRREIREELRAKVESWMRRTDDPLSKGPIPPRLNTWPGGEWEKEVERRRVVTK